MHVAAGPNGVNFATRDLQPLLLGAPNSWPWPKELMGQRDWHSMAVALGCIWLWCIALLPRVWRGRRGVRFAIKLFFARLTREPVSTWILAMGVCLSLATAAMWRWAELSHWQGLLTALFGMAVGCGLIWIVRVVGSTILGARRWALATLR